jgi:hypothetical protein
MPRCQVELRAEERRDPERVARIEHEGVDAVAVGEVADLAVGEACLAAAVEREVLRRRRAGRREALRGHRVGHRVGHRIGREVLRGSRTGRQQRERGRGRRRARHCPAPRGSLPAGFLRGPPAKIKRHRVPAVHSGVGPSRWRASRDDAAKPRAGLRGRTSVAAAAIEAGRKGGSVRSLKALATALAYKRSRR